VAEQPDITIPRFGTDRPRGQARRRDEDLLLLLLLLSMGDVALAVQLWDSLVPRPWRGLLNATPIDNVSTFKGTLPPFWFDVHTQRYGIGNRGFITQRAMFAVVDAFRDAAAKAQSQAVAQVYAAGVEVGAWQQVTEQVLKLVGLAVAIAAVGGAARVNDGLLEGVSEELKFHFRRLARFAHEVEVGAVTQVKAERRAAMYAESVVTNIFDDQRRISAVAAGYKYERNVLDPEAEHCRKTKYTPPGVPDCPSLTHKRFGGTSDADWVPIGMYPPPGKRICKWNCRCHLEFRRNAAEEN
jgi:hypothetical protein